MQINTAIDKALKEWMQHLEKQQQEINEVSPLSSRGTRLKIRGLIQRFLMKNK